MEYSMTTKKQTVINTPLERSQSSLIRLNVQYKLDDKSRPDNMSAKSSERGFMHKTKSQSSFNGYYEHVPTKRKQL